MKKIKDIVSTLPDKKRYAELITAVLSVPVLITVLLLNLHNLKPSTTTTTPTPTINSPTTSPTKTPAISETITPLVSSPPQSPSPPAPACTKAVGPVDITFPDEGEVISSNPVCVDITRSGTNYCEVAWSYRINNDAWSDYLDKSICLYNMSPGSKMIEVKVKSIASQDQVILKRTFTVPVSPTTVPTASSSATTQ